MRLLAVLFFLSATAALAQVAIQGPQATYNGQNVSEIDLIANPHRDVEPLRSLVVQRTSQPYSQEQIEASITALQNTHLFPKVEVSVVPEIAGLRLNFLLEPAYYVGIIRFPGAEALSYTRLLQAVDFSDQDPFVKDSLGHSEQSLETFLHRSGYFQASVHAAAPEIDDAHQIVNITFSVTLGPLARIGSLSFEGLDATEDARLTHSVQSLRALLTGGSLKSGKRYSPERIKSATTLIRRALTKQHYLASKVEEQAPVYHPETNRVDITFHTRLGPLVVVQTTGARVTWIPYLSGREMKKLIPIYSEGTIDPDLVHEGQQNLIDYFQKKSYFDVKVAVNLQRESNKVNLTYAIDKGKKHKVTSIAFTGNTRITERDLLPQVTVKKGHLLWHGTVSQKLLDQSDKNLQAFYSDKGYEEAKVTSQAIDHEPKIDVVFHITEGEQTLVGNVELAGNKNLTAKELAPSGLQLKAGKPFSPRLLNEDRNRISASYLEHGYLNVDVKVTAERSSASSHEVNVVYAVNEGQLIRVKDAVFLGQQHTRLSLIRESANIPVEAPMSRVKMLDAESSLYSLGIFDWASVGPRKPITSQTEEDALVKVHEAKRTDIIYGFGFEVSHRGGNVPTGSVAVPGIPPVQLGQYQIAPSQATFASPQGSIEIDRRNMRGLGETLGVSLLAQQLDQRAITTYTQPHFFVSHWSSVTSLSIERNTENPLFAASLGDASFQVEHMLNRKTNTRLQLRYDFNKTYLSHLLVPDLVLPQDQNVHLSTVSSTYLQDTRDKPLDAHHGHLVALTTGITPAKLGSSASFAKFFGQYAFYKPFHSIVLADSFRLGLAKEFAGSFVPTSQLFFSGGGTSLRGFPIDQAGPQRLVPFCGGVLQGQAGCVNINVPVGGNLLFILNSEVRFPLKIMKALGGVIFYDGGNVYSAINLNNFVNNYTNTVGVGLRYSTPIGPVRFDIGKNLNPIAGINSVQYYITLGQAF